MEKSLEKKLGSMSLEESKVITTYLISSQFQIQFIKQLFNFWLLRTKEDSLLMATPFGSQ
jgi:hypothetical protein